MKISDIESSELAAFLREDGSGPNSIVTIEGLRDPVRLHLMKVGCDSGIESVYGRYSIDPKKNAATALFEAGRPTELKQICMVDRASDEIFACDLCLSEFISADADRARLLFLDSAREYESRFEALKKDVAMRIARSWTDVPDTLERMIADAYPEETSSLDALGDVETRAAADFIKGRGTDTAERMEALILEWYDFSADSKDDHFLGLTHIDLLADGASAREKLSDRAFRMVDHEHFAKKLIDIEQTSQAIEEIAARPSRETLLRKDIFCALSKETSDEGTVRIVADTESGRIRFRLPREQLMRNLPYSDHLLVSDIEVYDIDSEKRSYPILNVPFDDILTISKGDAFESERIWEKTDDAAPNDRSVRAVAKQIEASVPFFEPQSKRQAELAEIR